MEIKFFCGGFCLFLLLCVPAAGLAAPASTARLPGVAEPMLQPGFWIDRAPASQQVILTPDQITAFNRSISAAMPQTVVDLDKFPDSVDKNTLRRWLAADKMPRQVERYSDGKLLHDKKYLPAMGMVDAFDERLADFSG